MLASIFISIIVNLRDRLWQQSDKVIQHQIVHKRARRSSSTERSSLGLWKVTFVCGANPKKIFRKCRDFQRADRGRKAAWP